MQTLSTSKISRDGGTQFLLQQRSGFLFVHFLLMHIRGETHLVDTWLRFRLSRDWNGPQSILFGDLKVGDTGIVHIVRHFGRRWSAKETADGTSDPLDGAESHR